MGGDDLELSAKATSWALMEEYGQSGLQFAGHES